MNAKPAGTQRSDGSALDPEAILENITDAFFTLDRDWRFTYVNREAERLLERPRSELLGRNIWQEFREAVDSSFDRNYHLAFETGKVVEFEDLYPPLGIWVQVRAHPAPDQLIVYFHDITEQRRTEDAIRVGRERLDIALHSLDLGLWYCDLPFSNLSWNAKTKEHFWLPPDADVDINLFYERLHPEDRERVRSAINTALAERQSFDIEYRTVAPEGQIKWIRAIGKGFYAPDGNPNRFDGVTVDITSQKNLLTQEKESRETAETLNRVGRALSGELDIEKLVHMITAAATELTHAQFGAFFYKANDEQGESYTLYALAGASREDFAGFQISRNSAVFASTFRGEGVFRSDDITKDSNYSEHGVSTAALSVRSYLAVPVVSRFGNVIGGLFFGHPAPGVFTEAHERIVIALASQAATAMDNAQLFTAAERARREAQESALALSKSNAELQQVAYVAAHDLQEPLRTIASFTQLLERRYRGAGDSSDELVNAVVDSVRRMHTLLNNLLEYTSLSSEEEKPSGAVDLNELLASCLLLMSSSIAAKQAVITSDDLPVVAPANMAQLKQLFVNLIDNALKYSRPGVPPVIRIAVAGGAPMCRFKISDNGEGFQQEYAKQIFGMFKRLHGRHVPGTGIGLALCKRIVEVHGGTIWAESAPGEGSTIHFDLPCRAR
jgi:PAS domain S-box-containing protein